MLQPGAWKLSLHTGLWAITAFCIHVFLRRPIQADLVTRTDPVPYFSAIMMSLLVGAGVTLLIWLSRNSINAPNFSMKPSRARVLIAAGIAAITPFLTIGWMPISLGGMTLAAIAGASMDAMGVIFLIGAFACAYPLAAMIAHHTSNRRLLRIAMITLVFWSTYSALLLWLGVVKFP